MNLTANAKQSAASSVSCHRLAGTFLFTLALCVLGSTPLHAFESEIVIAGSPDRGLCAISDMPAGPRTLYVVHAFNVFMTGSRFKIESGPGVTMTYLSETHMFPMTLGNTQDGISVCYGECTVGDQVIASIDYMAYGTSSTCSQMLVVPHPDAQTVEAIKCTGVPTAAFVQDMFISHAGSCGCPNAHGFSGTPQVFNCLPIAVASSTWGAIKALYRR